MGKPTEAQQRTIDSCDGHNIVCSLPGSGKTFTMVQCALALLKNPDYQLLLVTFTNAATEEMRSRLFEHLASEDRARVRIVTFDKLFVTLYRGQQRQRRERLCIGVEQWQLIDRAILESGIDYKFGEIPDISQAVDKFSRMANPVDDGSGDGNYFKVFRAYQTLKSAFNKVDLNDVTASVIRMSGTGAIKPLPSTHILVDEYQDVSSQQVQWLLQQGNQGKKIIAFGDDDQSIYGWRGSCGYDAFVSLQESFGSQGHVLDTCFRCTEEVLNTAAQLIVHNKDRIEKRFRSGAGSGGQVALYRASSREQMITEVVSSVVTTLYGRDSDNRVPLTQDTFGILARNNSHLKELQTALQKRGVAAELGRDRSILDEPEINTVLRVLHVIRYQDKSPFLGDVMMTLKVELALIKRITADMHDQGMARANLRGSPQSVKQLVKLSQDWRHTVRDKGSWQDRQRLLARIMPNSQLKRAVDRIFNLLQASGDDFWHQCGIWLRRLTQIRTNQSVERAQVELRTFHGAKGLEYDRVLVTHLQDNVIPGLDENEHQLAGQIEEARRLLFVAMTRAKTNLAMYCFAGGDDASKGPSRFLMQLSSGGYGLRELAEPVMHSVGFDL